MATAARPSRHLLLAAICLALHHLLACSATTGHPLHGRTTNTIVPATLPPHTTLDAPPAAAAGAGWPAADNRLGAPPSPSNVPLLPRHLNDSVVAGEDIASASSAAAAPAAAPPSLRACDDVDTRVASALHDVVTAPGGVTAQAVRVAALLHLLAVPFLPPPLAVLVALSALATPVRARSLASGGNSSGLTHATCTVYRYRPGGDAGVDRSEPFADLRSVVCPHPRCGDGTGMRARSAAHARGRGRLDDPFHAYCAVYTLIRAHGGSWCAMPVHLPVADPGAAVAAGGDVCYVELEHMGYREGYYIRCPPVRGCCQMPVVCCTEFPHDAVAAAVWDHRRLTYRDTVGSYYTANDTERPLLERQGYRDEL